MFRSQSLRVPETLYNFLHSFFGEALIEGFVIKARSFFIRHCESMEEILRARKEKLVHTETVVRTSPLASAPPSENDYPSQQNEQFTDAEIESMKTSHFEV